MRARLAALCCAAALTCCAEPDGSSDITQFGLIEAAADRPLVQESLDLVKTVLPQDATVTLTPGWKTLPIPRA